MLAAAPPHAHWWIWALRLLLIVAPIATAVHVLRFRARNRATRLVTTKAVAALLVFAAMSGLAASARAELVETDGHPALKNDQLSIFPIDDTNPEASVPPVEKQNEKPLQFGYYLQDLAAKVERAQQKGDTAAVIRYYRAIAKAAPRSPYGPRKLCEVLQSAGDIDGAIVACRTATVIEGTTVGDFRRLIRRDPGQARQPFERAA